MNKIMILAIIVLPALALGIFILWGSQGMREEGLYIKQKFWSNPDIPGVKELKSGDEFNVLSWNIAYAHGRGSQGIEYEQKSQKEYLQVLKQMSRVVYEEKADFLFFQEVDIQAKRTYYINQAQTIAAKTMMSEIAPVISWRVNYLPFPGNLFARSQHFGKVESGGAILSKYKLENHQYELLPKPSSNSWFYNRFYLSRYIQSVAANVTGELSNFVNLHLEAFKVKNRSVHIEHVLEFVRENKPLILAGDFNTFNTDGVQDLVLGRDSYLGDTSFQKLESGLPGNYSEALKDDLVLLNTFPAWDPNRRLDYIFYDKERLELVEAKVLTQHSNISDHLPIFARFKVR